MINKAIAKITEEMMKLNNPLAQAIEEHLTGLCTDEETATKLLADGKSLKNCCDSIRDEAKKRAKDRVAYIPPEEVFKMARDYYGIEEKTTKKIDVLDLL